MATLYFSHPSNYSNGWWGGTQFWFLNQSCTIPANRIPNSSDDVVITSLKECTIGNWDGYHIVAMTAYCKSITGDSCRIFETDYGSTGSSLIASGQITLSNSLLFEFAGLALNNITASQILLTDFILTSSRSGLEWTCPRQTVARQPQ